MYLSLAQAQGWSAPSISGYAPVGGMCSGLCANLSSVGVASMGGGGHL